MDRPSLLVLVRHAESMRNRAKKGNTYFTDEESRAAVKGIPDHKISLTERGWQEAEQTGLALHKHFGVFDYIYHSGYLRTVDTMAGILKAYNYTERNKMKIRQNMFIRERDSGHAYDMTTEEANAAFPYLQEYWDMFGGFLARPPGGESLAQVCERVYLFLNMLYRDRTGQKVMVITHGGTLRCFRYLLERWTFEEALTIPKANPPKNCGVTVYEPAHEGDRMVLKKYNTVYYTNNSAD